MGRRGNPRNRPRPPPLVVRLLAKGRDLAPVAQQLDAPRVGADPVDGPVEVGGLAVGREDLRVERVADSALRACFCFSFLSPARSFAADLHPSYPPIHSPIHPGRRRTAYRQDYAQNDHAKVEGLLRGPRRLLAGRELRPGHAAVVVERRDGPAARLGGRLVVVRGVRSVRRGTTLLLRQRQRQRQCRVAVAGAGAGAGAAVAGVQCAGPELEPEPRDHDSIHRGDLVAPIAWWLARPATSNGRLALLVSVVDGGDGCCCSCCSWC